jgi:predicted short-subunit dehydrogenase-like oxidoreductase (DUF2520 family)
VFSFHPLQTFPRDFPPRRILPSARGIWYGVDGSARAMRVARRLARALRGRIVEIPAPSRELYHAACVVASNHLTVLLSVVRAMHAAASPAGAPTLAPYRPIIEATIANVLATSPAEALSGPVARGGVETVARHLQSVEAALPWLVPYFTMMTAETVRLADAKGSLAPDRRRALEELITTYSQHLTKSGTRQ